MLKKLLDLKVILIVLLIVSWVVVGIFFFKFKGDTEAQLAAKDSQISDLETSLSEIGELVPAYVVASDVPSGKQIEESDVTQIDVPLSMSDNLVQDYDELIGKYFKLGMTAGTVITSNAIYEEVITPDMRYYDVMVDVMPIGLQVGSFVDIRIKNSNGSDRIGISHRQVAQINGNCLKLILTEEDILMFSGMLSDNVFLQGTLEFKGIRDENNDGKVDNKDTTKIDCGDSYIYAVEYVEGGVQDRAAKFYSPNKVVRYLLTVDPNIHEETFSPEERELERQFILAGLFNEDGTVSEAFESFLGRGGLKEYVQEYIKEGLKAYEKRMEEELKNAE